MYFRSVIRKKPEDQRDWWILPFGVKLPERERQDLPQNAVNGWLHRFPSRETQRRSAHIEGRVKRKETLFEEEDKEAIMWADQYWEQLVKSGKIDVSNQHFEKKKRMINADTMRHKDVR